MPEFSSSSRPLAAAILAIVLAGPARAADAANGARLADQWCAACHIVKPGQQRGSADVPPFSAIAAKFPEIGNTFYKAGPCYGTERLSAHLSRLSEKGLLRIEDTEIAARQFLDLCKTGIHLRMLLGHLEAPPRAEVENNVRRAVQVFLAAYAPK